MEVNFQKVAKRSCKKCSDRSVGMNALLLRRRLRKLRIVGGAPETASKHKYRLHFKENQNGIDKTDCGPCDEKTWLAESQPLDTSDGRRDCATRFCVAPRIRSGRRSSQRNRPGSPGQRPQ